MYSKLTTTDSVSHALEVVIQSLLIYPGGRIDSIVMGKIQYDVTAKKFFRKLAFVFSLRNAGTN